MLINIKNGSLKYYMQPLPLFYDILKRIFNKNFHFVFNLKKFTNFSTGEQIPLII